MRPNINFRICPGQTMWQGVYLPSGMSGKQVQMYCAIQTKRRSSLGPDPKDVIAGPEVVPLPSLVLANVFRVMLLIN